MRAVRERLSGMHEFASRRAPTSSLAYDAAMEGEAEGEAGPRSRPVKTTTSPPRGESFARSPSGTTARPWTTLSAASAMRTAKVASASPAALLARTRTSYASHASRSRGAAVRSRAVAPSTG